MRTHCSPAGETAGLRVLAAYAVSASAYMAAERPGVRRQAHELVLPVNPFTASFPDREKSGLRAQMRRAAVSIPANIAEEFGKRSLAEKERFLNIAEGSLEECRYDLILAADLGYGTQNL